MDILTLLIVIPLLTILALIFCDKQEEIRITAAIGMSIQFLLTIYLVFAYLGERNSGNNAEMLFTKSYTWFESLNISYSIGVDGISVIMTTSTYEMEIPYK